jgi:hypothetical protein
MRVLLVILCSSLFAACLEDTFRGEMSKRSDRRQPPSEGEKERGEEEEAASLLLSESCHGNGLLILSAYIIDS